MISNISESRIQEISKQKSNLQLEIRFQLLKRTGHILTRNPFIMNKTSYSSKPTQSFMSATPNPSSSPKKQFPSVSLSKHLQDYKAYRSIENKKKYPDTDKNTSYMISPEQKSILMNRNMDMPSIHNAHDMLLTDGFTQAKVQKLQLQILKTLIQAKSLKKQEEWRLYMTKSELIDDKSPQFQEIQEYLLKFISKCLDKTLAFSQNFNLTVLNRQSESSQRQNSRLGPGNLQTNDRKMNKTSSSFLQSSNGLNKKTVQPSLRVLKEQLNTLALNSRDGSFTQVNNTKTAINFRPDNQNKTTLIEKMQARHEEEINRLTFERSLLQKKLQLYQSRITHLESRMREQNVPIDVESSSQPAPFNSEDPSVAKRIRRPTAAQQQMMNNLINQNKYKSEAEFKQIQNQTLVKQLSIVKEHSFKMKIENEKLKNRLEDLQKQCQECREFKKYRQLWLMQAQQTIGWKNLWRQKKDQTMKLVNKIKILKQKNKQLLHSFNFSMVVNPDQQQDKQQLENIIKSFQEWLKVMSVPRVNCPIIDAKSLMEEQGLKEHEYMPDHEHLNYKLLRPNFFIFFEAYEKTIMMEKNILNTRPLQSTFFVKIRAILDSMYNHFNSYGNYKHWTSFPEFVIGFLEKYEINFTTLKMQPRKKSMPSEEKLTFLMNLFNKKLSNTWQCDMFRSFILEEYTLDQIYFFLDCRNDLNGGMTLTHGFGIIDPVSYVKLHKALATAQRKLSPYENYIIERVKTILKSRRRQKNGEFFIDRYFVLKLLLEVYALQKTKSQRIFQASFKTKPNNKKQNVSYSDYFAFMAKNFDFLTTIDICELYRETYALSSGKITYKAVHFVCQSKGLFIPLIWSKRLNMNVLDKSLNSDMILLDLQNNTRKMNGHLTEMGVQEVARLENDLNYFLRQVDWYRNNRQVFYFKVQEMKMKILKANCLLDWQSSTYTPNELLSTDEIRQGIMQIHGLIHQSDNSLRVLNRRKQEKEKAIKQITRNFKIRIQESMKEFRRIDDQQLKKLKSQMAFEIKMRQKREKQQAQAEKQQQGDNNEGENKEKEVIVGNSFANVNEMMKIQMSEKKERQAKFSLVKDQVKDDEKGNSLSVKDKQFAGRRPSKLVTIVETSEHAS